MARRSVTRDELDTPLTPYLDALEAVLAATPRLAPTEVPIEEATGCIAAADVRAPRDLPGFRNSAMDGYAVNSRDLEAAGTDTSVALPIKKAVLAGHAPTDRLNRGTCAEIGTGAEVPEGADAVVPYEEVRQEGKVAVFLSSTRPGAHIRPADDVIKKGTLLVAAGEVLNPVRIGLLAQCGISLIRATPRPRVAILSTGDEIVPPGTPFAKGYVYDANTYLLAEVSRAAGCRVVSTRVVPDTKRKLYGAVRSASEQADLVIVSGGASVGPHDWAKEVTGLVRVWRVALKPGKPFGYATGPGGTPVLLLPGNPGSALVAFAAFGLDIVAKLSGNQPPIRIRGRLTRAVLPDPKRTLVRPVKLRSRKGGGGRRGLVEATPLLTMSSASLYQFKDAEGVALLPPGRRPRRTAEILVLPWAEL